MNDSAAVVAVEARALTQRVTLAGRELTILEDVGFTIHAGEAVAIVGASGSGKSTLIGLLAGLDMPSSGEVVLAGQALKGLDEDARARLRGARVGFVFQNFQLLPALTALENVMLPLELAGHADPESAAREVLARFLADDKPKQHKPPRFKPIDDKWTANYSPAQ